MKTIKQSPGLWTTAILCSLLMAGCSYQQYQAHPIEAAQGRVSLRAHDVGESGFIAYLREEGYTTPPDQWGWRELMYSALYFHPDLDLARAQLSLAMASITTAGQRPNPSFSLGAGRRTEPDVPEVYSLSFSIPVETAGKRQARIDVATQLSESARLNIAQTSWNLRFRLLSSWIELNAAWHNLGLLEQEAELRQQIIDLLKVRLQAGMVSSVELSNAKLQWQSVQQLTIEEQGRIEEFKTQVASHAGLPLNKFQQLKLEQEPTEALLHAQHNIALIQNFDAATQDAALLNRVDIRAGLARYAASEARLRLEIARQYPDINLIPAYDYEEGFHIWSLGINSLLNVMHKNQGLIAEAKALRETEAAQFESLQARVIAAIDSAKIRYLASIRALEQARHVLHTQQEQFTQASMRFDHGFADRLELTTHQLENVIAQRRVLAAEFQVQRSAAMLEDSMQLPLENLGEMPTIPNRPRPTRKPSQEITS